MRLARVKAPWWQGDDVRPDGRPIAAARGEKPTEHQKSLDRFAMRRLELVHLLRQLELPHRPVQTRQKQSCRATGGASLIASADGHGRAASRHSTYPFGSRIARDQRAVGDEDQAASAASATAAMDSASRSRRASLLRLSLLAS